MKVRELIEAVGEYSSKDFRSLFERYVGAAREVVVRMVDMGKKERDARKKLGEEVVVGELEIGLMKRGGLMGEIVVSGLGMGESGVGEARLRDEMVENWDRYVRAGVGDRFEVGGTDVQWKKADGEMSLFVDARQKA